MDEPRYLPHLAAACRSLLGDDDIKKIPAHVRTQVACRAKVGQVTVDRFLRGERVPRGEQLDEMVAAVAAVTNSDWYVPWREATERAEAAKVDWKRFLSGELPIAADPEQEPGGEKPQPPVD